MFNNFHLIICGVPGFGFYTDDVCDCVCDSVFDVPGFGFYTDGVCDVPGFGFYTDGVCDVPGFGFYTDGGAMITSYHGPGSTL